MSEGSPLTASIVVPTYNPHERIFARVLSAVGQLLEASDRVECVVVDNRSTSPVAEMGYVRKFLAAHPCARIVREEMQGLTHARLAGIRATSGDVIAVFDDDNVPDREYVNVVRTCLEKCPWVGVWGPGTIDVELLDPVPPSIEHRIRETFNQRADRFVEYGCVPASWQNFYPIGMGQVIRRAVAESYRAAVEQGSLTATDRAGGSLASAGDAQIVWQSIIAGYAAGIHPDLKVKHLIPASRTTLRYMKRLAFGTGMSYHPALVQSFPEEYERIRCTMPTTRQIVSLLARQAAKSAWGGPSRVRWLPVEFSNTLGLICGRLTAGGQLEHWSFRLAKKLGLT